MSKILFSFWWLVFLTWLFQFLNIPYLNPIQISFLKEYNFEWIISTQYMFTTLWAIFAFWYWYKRYENSKEINNTYQEIITLEENISDEDFLKKWSTNQRLYKKWALDKNRWLLFESKCHYLFFERYEKSKDKFSFLYLPIKEYYWDQKYFLSFYKRKSKDYLRIYKMYKKRKEEKAAENYKELYNEIILFKNLSKK